MILRRVIEHVRKQEWTAIWIDLAIVVVGVFIGIQVSNWNETRVDGQREHQLLRELRTELADSITQTERRRKAAEQVRASGERAIAFLDKGKGCGDACWPVIVDFFHASQWQQLTVALPTYEEMRRNGWPRKRQIVDAMETYKLQSHLVASPNEQAPAYRNMVRGLIPLAIHRPYWSACYQLTDGGETYLEGCASGVPPEISAAGVDAIVKDPDIHRALTQWAGFVSFLPEILDEQNQVASQALALIDTELAAQP